MIESDDSISDDEIISSNNVMADFTLPAAGQKPNFNSTLFPNQQGSSSTPSSQLKKKSRLEQLKEEEDFVFLAPMNSMAACIGGLTLHSWAEIKWMNPQGEVIQPTRPTEGIDVPQLTVKMLKLR